MENKLKFLLRLGDDSMILGQRLSELCGHGPILEEDIAMTNIALDLIGQATNIYTYAATLSTDFNDADGLAFLRFEHQYYNAVLVEQPNGNFGDTLVRQFFFDAFRVPLFQQMMQSKDETIAAIAEKSLKETRYHLKHSSEWVIRLGDGTELSHERAQLAVFDLWRYTQELFHMDDAERELVDAGIIPNLADLRGTWLQTVESVMQTATLQIPENQGFFGAGRLGRHSEYMGYILAQMQYMQRAYPGMQW
ncbi:MAG: phenylacetate-CoA oxygenase subunit PaaI [Flavobacteriia bacterium]|jgi:ring-1,2-phenylacetyl-CoA epoxidase subunit PaaC|nr:phenylacetate-CoA oxygenase subunit PaaI [Flavobacteriia bacterium]